MRRIALAVLAVTLISLPVQAFEDPLPLPDVPPWMVANWRAAWAIEAVGSLDLDMLGEWRFMRDHYFPGPERRSQPTRPRKTVVLPNPAPTTRQAYSAGVEQWRPLVAWYWPADHVERMLRIMECESHGIPTATNTLSGAAGLFQIMPGWQKTWPGDYYDPWTNAAVAYQIWLTQGYAAWVCRG